MFLTKIVALCVLPVFLVPSSFKLPFFLLMKDLILSDFHRFHSLTQFLLEFPSSQVKECVSAPQNVLDGLGGLSGLGGLNGLGALGVNSNLTGQNPLSSLTSGFGGLSGLTGMPNGTGQNLLNAILGFPPSIISGLGGSVNGNGQSPFASLFSIPAPFLGMGSNAQGQNPFAALFNSMLTLFGSALNTMQGLPLVGQLFSGRTVWLVIEDYSKLL